MRLRIDRLAQASRWRRRSLTEKAVLALGLLILALVLPPWPGAALAAVAAWGAALAGARVRPRDWLALLAAPLGFALTGAATLAIELGPDGVALARDGGAAAVATLLRAMAAVSALVLLAATTPVCDLVRGLGRLGVAAEICDMALLIWRFLFLLLESAGAIRQAQDARLGWNGIARARRSFGLMVAQLLPRALDRARRMDIGLAARGFDGHMPQLATGAAVSPAFVLTALGTQGAVTGVTLWLT